MLIPSIRQSLQSMFQSSRSGRSRQRRRSVLQATEMYAVIDRLEDRTMLSASNIAPFVDFSATHDFADSKLRDVTNDLVLQADGKIVVVGNRHDSTFNSLMVARYNVDGSVDNSFNGVGFNT
jgi:hypothetical protein